MKKTILLIAISIISVAAYAQQRDFMYTLEDIVVAMRDHPGKRPHWDAAVATLSTPDVPMVALLDNLEIVEGEKANEYHKSDAEPLHANGAVSKAYSARKGKITSKGDFYNSLARGINYSMTERTVKGQSTITYILKGHKGTQDFVIIPAEGAKSTLSFLIAVDGKKQEDTIETSKITRCHIPAMAEGATVQITVVNGGGKPQSFVIINHNAKK